jgi:hypothetical protein
MAAYVQLTVLQLGVDNLSVVKLGGRKITNTKKEALQSL